MAMLHDMEVEDYLAKSVQVEPMALQEEYTQVGSDLAYWGRKHADALKAYKLAYITRKRTEARVYMEARAAARESGEKITDPGLEAKVALSEEAFQARLAEATAEAEEVNLKSVFTAVQAKKEMLISMGAHIRKEMDGDIAVARRLQQEAEARRG